MCGSSNQNEKERGDRKNMRKRNIERGGGEREREKERKKEVYHFHLGLVDLPQLSPLTDGSKQGCERERSEGKSENE